MYTTLLRPDCFALSARWPVDRWMAHAVLAGGSLLLFSPSAPAQGDGTSNSRTTAVVAQAAPTPSATRAKPSSAAASAPQRAGAAKVGKNSTGRRSAATTTAAAPLSAPEGSASMPSGRANVATISSQLADLGLALHRSPALTASFNGNSVLSPLSVATAMGLVHAGSAGETRREIGLLLSSANDPDLGMAMQLPALLQGLSAGGAEVSPLIIANRVWVASAWQAKVVPAYSQAAKSKFGGDIVGVAFDDPPAAVKAINSWVSEATKGMIPTLVNESVLQPDTRAVVTNAVYFKSAWARPFDPALTKQLPFGPAGKTAAMMTDDRSVAAGEFGGTEVYELPFRGDQFALLMAVPAKDRPLSALIAGASGLDLATWRAGLTPKRCILQMPRFSVKLPSTSLRAPLQAMGVKTAFSPQADLKPMLGPEAGNVQLSEVMHAASIIIDEAGGEASAATAAIAVARSAAMPDLCSVDRPFFYVLLHKPTGAPLFIGQVVDPSLP